MDMQIPEIVAIVSALVAIASLTINFFVVRRQIALHAEEVGAAVDAEKVRWMVGALDVFAEAETLAAQRGDDVAGRAAEIAARFSTQADAGRLYFPNAEAVRDGADAGRGFAFQGKRHPAIDAVIMAHDLARDLPRFEGGQADQVQALLWRCRRVLVSEVQRSVDPRRREEAIEAQTRRSKKDREGSHKEVGEVLEAIKALPMSKVSFT